MKLETHPPSHPDQPSTQNPRETDRKRSTFKELSDGRWQIDFADESAQLSPIAGFHYLHEILAHSGAPVCLASAEMAGPGLWIREPLTDMSLGQCKSLARDLQELASVAWDRNHRDEYDKLTRERVALRKFTTECFGPGGRRRYTATPITKEQHAVVEAIRRALDRIKQSAPDAACHLRGHIHSTNGEWTYSGGLTWDTQVDEGEVERYLDSLPEVPDPVKIRSRWQAESKEPFREPIRRSPMETAKTQLEKLEVLRAIRRGVGVAAKPFRSQRDPYTSRGLFQERYEDQDEIEIKEKARKALRGYEGDRFELGDDRDTGHYESER